jgi:hypothetical protein
MVCCRFLCLVVAAVTCGTTICTAWTWTRCSGVASKTVDHFHKSLKHVIYIMPKWMWCMCMCACACVCVCVCVIGCFVPDISNECAALIFSGLAVWEEKLFFLPCFIPEWSWRHCDLAKHWEPLAPWHSVTSPKTWIFRNTVVRISQLCMMFAYSSSKIPDILSKFGVDGLCQKLSGEFNCSVCLTCDHSTFISGSSKEAAWFSKERLTVKNIGFLPTHKIRSNYNMCILCETFLDVQNIY